MPKSKAFGAVYIARNTLGKKLFPYKWVMTHCKQTTFFLTYCLQYKQHLDALKSGAEKERKSRQRIRISHAKKKKKERKRKSRQRIGIPHAKIKRKSRQQKAGSG